MAKTSRHITALPLLLLASCAGAQVLSNVPTLGSSSASSAKSTDGATTATPKTTVATTQNAATATTGSNTFALTGSGTATGSSIFHLSDVPTIAGAGIPTLVIPYTANAPYMQKSSLPEGTFFIAVGAVLAFLGACVLLWRAMVAWSTNRSVRRTAMASVRGGTSEKSGRSNYWSSSSGGGGGGGRSSSGGHGQGYNPVPPKSTLYKDNGSSLSLDRLTSAGKTSKPHFRESHMSERSTTPPSNLFFSPTAQAAANRDNRRSSGYMPSGFYASPSSHAAGGDRSTTLGSIVPPNRNSTYRDVPSPPDSPGLRPATRGSGGYRPRDTTGLSVPGNRNSISMYAQPSRSSLMVGAESLSDSRPTSRAPSAYLEDMLDGHGSGNADGYGGYGGGGRER